MILIERTPQVNPKEITLPQLQIHVSWYTLVYGNWLNPKVLLIDLDNSVSNTILKMYQQNSSNN